MGECRICGSYAINPGLKHGSQNPELCDPCYWKAEFEREREHLDWSLKHAARIDGENLAWGRASIYAMGRHLPIVDGDVDGAIDAAMERK